MSDFNDVEKVIEFLKAEKGITINAMMEKLGLERGGFLSWRTSTKEKRREALAKKLKEVFAQHFEGIEAETTGQKGIEGKYIAYLEKEIERLRLENDRLFKWLENEIKALAAKNE